MIIKPEIFNHNSINSLQTTRLGGASQGPYESMNLGVFGNDKPQVLENISLLTDSCNLPHSPVFLEQIHGSKVVEYIEDQGIKVKESIALEIPDNLEVAATCRNAINAFEILETQQIDLLFLDIQMPKLTGIDFLKSIAVILLTGCVALQEVFRRAEGWI